MVTETHAQMQQSIAGYPAPAIGRPGPNDVIPAERELKVVTTLLKPVRALRV